MTQPIDPNSHDAASNFMPDPEWLSATGRGVTVAMIDSGVDATHPDLSGRIAEEVGARIEGKKVTFSPVDDGDLAGHGTACAGIITQLAPEAKIASIRVLGASGSGDAQVFLAGLEYAVKQRFKIINLSLGTTKPQFFAPLHDLLDRAYQAGCIVVAAANNLPQPSFPSIFSSSLISVVKSEEPDPLKFRFHYGEVIELTAPGVSVRTPWVGGGYRTLTGNSFACPHITGLLARLVERHPELTPFQAKSALYAIARSNSADGVQLG
ncbi:MAG: S8 family serine peptidase [Acidobacteria bacterium]|nr:S8 family serine peptidase [Acidobacteriota bacterium]